MNAVVCCGMFRSGSTWQYNVVRELLARAGVPHVMLGHFEGDRFAEKLAGITTRAVFKSHSAHPAYDAAFAEGRLTGIYCYRDLRDVAYSMVHKAAGTFAETVVDGQFLEHCIENDRFWRRPGVLVQRYETLFADEPRSVREIADLLRLNVPDDAVREIAEGESIERVRRRTTALANKLQSEGVDLSARANAFRYDPETLLHWNHLRDGKPGGWRDMATPAERAHLHRVAGAWLVENGYETDDAWAS